MIVGGYSLHVYCEIFMPEDGNPLSPPHPQCPNPGCHEFGGPNLTAAKRSARKRGWAFRGELVFCKGCK